MEKFKKILKAGSNDFNSTVSSPLLILAVIALDLKGYLIFMMSCFVYYNVKAWLFEEGIIEVTYADEDESAETE